MKNNTKIPLYSKLPSEKINFNMPFKLQEMTDSFSNRKGTGFGPTQPLTLSWSILI